MTPQEIAMKFSGASATCRSGSKCPYMEECTGKASTCKLKEVAMTIRAQELDIETWTAEYKSLLKISRQLLDYIMDLENINAQYRSMIKSFQAGYRQSKLPKRRKPRKKEQPKTLEEMDGDKRYEQKVPKKKPDPPVVIIG